MQASYGLASNLTEVIWKRMVQQAFPNKKEYQVIPSIYIYIYIYILREREREREKERKRDRK